MANEWKLYGEAYCFDLVAGLDLWVYYNPQAAEDQGIRGRPWCASMRHNIGWYATVDEAKEAALAGAVQVYNQLGDVLRQLYEKNALAHS